MADRVIGLDIGTSSIKAAQVARVRGGTLVVEKQAAVALPPGAVADGRVAQKDRGRVIEVIRALFDKADFATKDVILGLNSSSGVFMNELLVPLMRPEDMSTALPGILTTVMDSSVVSESEISYTVVGEEQTGEGRKLRVLIYAVRSDYADSLAEVAHEAGLNVVGADLNALAALRAVRVQQRPPRQVDALVDIGGSVTSILIHHNGVPKMLLLDPDSASSTLNEKIADTLGYEHDDPRAEQAKIDDQHARGPVSQARREYALSLAQKIATAFRAFIERSDDYDAIANVVLVGGGAHLPELGGALKHSLGTVPLAFAGVADEITTPNGGQVQRSENESGGDYLVAVGLATGTKG